jgi:invasion protein IalB
MQRFRWTVPVLMLLTLAGVSVAHAQQTIKPQDSAWVKLCEKANAVTKDKDGNEERKEVKICLTHHERLDGKSGMVLVSAAVRQIEGRDKQHFMIMVPLDMQIRPGLRASIYPKDQWELALKNEKTDETRLKGIELGYTLCHPAGCTAEVEATGELLDDLRTSGGLVVSATNSAGAPVAFPVPLVGFAEAFAGPPVEAIRRGSPERGSPERPFVCAAAEWGKAEWRGCSMKPIQAWSR